jgi:hypothetical protein
MPCAIFNYSLIFLYLFVIN